MGIDEAIALLRRMAEEYLKQYTRDELDIITKTCIQYVRLWTIHEFRELSTDEKECFEAYKSALKQVGNKLLLTLVNEAEQYTTVSKILKTFL